jgi:histone arginine demethylase JMJD6
MNAIALESGRETPAPPAGSLGIARRSSLSFEDFRDDYMRPGVPVIITDATRQWPAVGKWSTAWLKESFGDRMVRIDGKDYRMDGFIEWVERSTSEDPAPYLRNYVIREHFPELMDDIQPPLPYFASNWLARKYLLPNVHRHLNRAAELELYVGGTGQSFPVLHYDGLGSHAFLMQLHGVKRYIVYPPEQTRFLYPTPGRRNISQVRDLHHPDLETFPLFAQAEPTIFELHPGETLFVPSGWWHTAEILTPSITVSINTVNQWNWSALVRDLTYNHPVSGLLRHAYLTAAGLVNLVG